MTLYKSILHPHLTKVILSIAAHVWKGWGGRFLSQRAVLSWGTRIKALPNHIIPFIMLAQLLHLVYRSLLPGAWHIRWRIQNSSGFVKLIATEGDEKRKKKDGNQWSKNKYETHIMVFLPVFTSYRLTESWWETQKALKCPRTDQQDCPLWACLPCCSYESCVWLAGATVHLLAWCDSLCGQDHLEWWPGFIHSKDVHVLIPAKMGKIPLIQTSPCTPCPLCLTCPWLLF